MKTLHRIITPVIAFCVFPAAIFLPLFRIMVVSGFAQGETKTNLLSLLGLGEYISVKDIYTLYKHGAESSAAGTLKAVWESLNKEGKSRFLRALPAKGWGICFLVSLLLVLLTALALLICAAVLKRTSVSLILSGLGIFSTIIMNYSFNVFAKPFLSGAFSLKELLGSAEGALSKLLGNMANVDYMKLGIAYSAILLIFVAALIFSIAALAEQKSDNG